MGYKVKRILVGTQQVRPEYSFTGEVIAYIMDADSSGNLYVPTSGKTTSGVCGVSYNWKISVDEGQETTYSGTGSSTSYITLSGYTPSSRHLIVIKPTSETYGWARAYSWDGNYSRSLNVVKIIYDGSYMGYAVSATSTGDYFRTRQYISVKFLSTALDEYLPDTVTTIGNYFRYSQYAFSKITSTSDEVLPSSVTSIGQRFRQEQYSNCTSLIEIKGWKDLSIGGNYYRHNQFDGCTANKTVKVIGTVGYSSYNNNALANSYVTNVYVLSSYLTTFKNTANYPRAGITDSKFVGY